MNKINNTKKYNTVLSLGILAMLTFDVMSLPTLVSAESYNNGFSYGVYTVDPFPSIEKSPETNPKPVINSINPKSSNVGTGTKTITITGEGFVSGSIARVNGSNRTTTFIDSSHLLMQVTGNDTYKYHSNGGFFITVFNGAPGGGYSNTAFFTVNKNIVSTPATTDNINDNSGNSTDFTDTTLLESEDSTTSNEYSDLAANVLLGSNGSFASGLVKWVFFAILVLLIVILVRRIYGADKRYHAIPLKHD